MKPIAPHASRRLSRRALLGALAGGSGVGLLVRRRAEARLRPPGAQLGSEFDARCIRCFRCAEVCPPKAIRFDALLDPRGAYTPYIDPQTSACTLCMQCTGVCPTGALLPIDPAPEVVFDAVKMGRPVLDRRSCITWNRSGNCRLCYYACPYADRAVSLTGIVQGPIFDPAQCVGCGLCAEACPSQAKAIRIEPLEGT